VREQPEYPTDRRTYAEPLRSPAELFSLLLLLFSLVLLGLNAGLLAAADLPDTDLPDELPGAGALVGALAVALFAVAAGLVGVSRAAWSPLLVAVPALGVWVTTWFVDSATGRAAAVAGVVSVSALVAAVWHRRTERPQQAWGGAAPALLIGLATLVAVLFSTGITLVAGDRLNGGPRVTALSTQYEQTLTPPELRVAADARLEDGWLELTDGGATVRRGLVQTSTLADADGPDEHLTSRPLDSGTLVVPGGVLHLRDTCVLDEDGLTFLADSSVSLPVDDGSPAARVDISGERGDADVPPGVYEACQDVAPAPVRAVSATPTVLTVPAPFMWFATAVVPLLALTVVLLVAIWLRIRRKTFDAIDALAEQDLGFDGEKYIEAGRRKRRIAAFTHRGEAVLSALGAPAIIAAIAVVVGVVVGGAPWDLGLAPGFVRGLGNVGLYVCLGLALGLLAIGARLRSSAGLRRGVGVVWDLSTFWPRVAHPFAPPCYSERVVPQIAERVEDALGSGARVVLSGHSQGSTVLTAVLWRLAADQASFGRVRFVSYGSQLRAWFGRIFPDLIGPAVLGHEPTTRPRMGNPSPDAPLVDGSRVDPPAGTLAHRLGVHDLDPRWRSLYRRTDPIGFRVHQETDGQNPVDVYVSEVLPPSAVTSKVTVGTHSDYPATPKYAEVVGPWLRSDGDPGGS
jgi:hypothetical protein